MNRPSLQATDRVVDALATYRLTRLWTRDSLPPVVHARHAWLDRFGNHPLGDLAECAWCSSWWIALGVTAARAIAPKAWQLVAVPLAYSAVAGWLADQERPPQ
jgi:hypothetical protein